MPPNGLQNHHNSSHVVATNIAPHGRALIASRVTHVYRELKICAGSSAKPLRGEIPGQSRDGKRPATYRQSFAPHLCQLWKR